MNRRDFFKFSTTIATSIGLLNGEELIAAIDCTKPLTVENVEQLAAEVYPPEYKILPEDRAWCACDRSAWEMLILELQSQSFKNIGQLRKHLLQTRDEMMVLDRREVNLYGSIDDHRIKRGVFFTYVGMIRGSIRTGSVRVA